mgnify:FL=1
MDLNNILSIYGCSGLFTLKTQTSHGIVATSIVDEKRIITSTNQQISMLSEIQIYCIGKGIPLSDVFKKILVFEKGRNTTIKIKSRATDLEKYFFNILDDYDKDRVYPSDIKKIIRWFNILVNKEKIKLVKSEIDLKPDQKEDKSTSKKFYK